MKIIIGLGNPGVRYERTRHNIGWMVLDAVAEKLGDPVFRPAKGEYYEASCKYHNQDVLLVKPTTYMNESGVAVDQVKQRYNVADDEILIILDELQFPVGRIQLKPSGSDSGHNGLRSVIWHLQSEQVPRLRCGIGNDFERGEMANYVLSMFRPDEQETVGTMVNNARDAVLLWVEQGIQAMATVNVRNKAEQTPDLNANPESTQDEI